jgi:hypothetical protein
VTTLREELQRIYDDRGRMTPQILLDEARDPDHVLHARFEWDDSVAAEQWRVAQAAELIRSVKIRFRTPAGKQGEVRAFHVTKEEATGSSVYRPTEEIVQDPFARELLLRDMNRDWRLFKARYEHLKEFADLVGGAAAEVA